MPPSSVAFRDERPPPSLPTGVRAVPRITVLGMGLTIASGHGRSGPPPTTRPTPAPTRSSSACSTARASPHDVEDGALRRAASTPARRAPSSASSPHAHAAGRRWILVGLGARDDFDAERARIAAAAALGRARELGTRTLCWELPHKVPDAVAGALVEGTLLAAYRYTAYKTRAGDGPRARARWSSPPTTTSPRRSRRGASAPRPPTARATSQRARQRADAGGARRAGARARRRAGRGHGPRRRSRRPGWARSPPSRRAPTREPQLITLRYEPAGRAPARCSGSSARR